MEMEEPDMKSLVFLTIIISLFDGQIFNYKQLTLDTKIGDPSIRHATSAPVSYSDLDSQVFCACKC